MMAWSSSCRIAAGLVVAFLCGPLVDARVRQAASTWVTVGPDGRLRYAADSRGNRIMDFSHAGYNGGGVELPTVRVARTIRPVAGDNTTHIQNAIDQVAALARDADGFRGAVVLERGTYDVAGP